MAKDALKAINENKFLIGLIIAIIGTGSLLVYRVDANEKAIMATTTQMQDCVIQINDLEKDVEYMREGIDRLETLMTSIDKELRDR